MLKYGTVLAFAVTAIFLTNLAAGYALGQSIGVTVTRLNEPADPVAPDLPASAPSDPATPVVSVEEEQSAWSSTGAAAGTSEYTATRQYGSSTVKVAMDRNYGSLLQYSFINSYGCSIWGYNHIFDASAGNHVDAVPYLCTNANPLPTAPQGLSREMFWKLIEQDAFWEAKYGMLAAAQVNVRQGCSGANPPSWCTASWATAFIPRALERTEYIQWLRDQYTDHYSSDWRGVVYNEQTVAQSCGGVWFPWAAPFGCAIVTVNFQTRILAAVIGSGTTVKIDPVSGKAVRVATAIRGYNNLYFAATDPVGVVTEKWSLAATPPPPDGLPNYPGQTIQGVRTAMLLMGRSATFGAPSTFQETPNNSSVTTDCGPGSGQYDFCWTGILTKTVIDSRAKGEVIGMSEDDWKTVIEYFDHLSLVDKLIFVEYKSSSYILSGEVDAWLQQFDAWLSAGGVNKLTPYGHVGGVGYRAADSIVGCGYLKFKQGADLIRQGLIVRDNFSRLCYEEYRTAHPSGSAALLQGEGLFDLLGTSEFTATPLSMISVPGLMIVDMNDWWYVVVIFGIVCGFLMNRRKKKRM